MAKEGVGTRLKNRILNIILWSVVSAAFIGPGTVTTATKAGALYGFDLLWALVFSTFACLLLQEAAARIAIVSGLNLGQAIAKVYEGKSTRVLVLIMVVGAIILGSAAYEAGNILGATEGVKFLLRGVTLISPETHQSISASVAGIFGVEFFVNYVLDNFLAILIVSGMGILSTIALNLRSLHAIARFMGFIVMFMGFAFIYTAFKLNPSFTDIMKGALIPSMPSGAGAGAGLLILGLVGTTVVPYDLFLGSGVLEKKQAVGEMRFGLSVAVISGGLISMAVMVVGTAIEGEFSYNALIEALTIKVGPYAVYIFGFGMFAAGFSSAITAPLASAITARSLFEKENPEKWKTQSLYFKIIWGGVLATGLLFGLMQVKPIPAIILAQALNGLILPFVGIFLWFVVNDYELMGEEVNGWGSNILLGIVVGVTLILGMVRVTAALNEIWEFAIQRGLTSFVFISFVSILASMWMLFVIYNRRKRQQSKKDETQA